MRKAFWSRSKGVILDPESPRKEKRGRERGIKASRIDTEKGRELEKNCHREVTGGHVPRVILNHAGYLSHRLPNLTR